MYRCIYICFRNWYLYINVYILISYTWEWSPNGNIFALYLRTKPNAQHVQELIFRPATAAHGPDKRQNFPKATCSNYSLQCQLIDIFPLVFAQPWVAALFLSKFLRKCLNLLWCQWKFRTRHFYDIKCVSVEYHTRASWPTLFIHPIKWLRNLPNMWVAATKYRAYLTWYINLEETKYNLHKNIIINSRSFFPFIIWTVFYIRCL